MNLDIIFRSCSIHYAVHDGRRVVEGSKEQLILRCLRSLIRSIEKFRASQPYEDISLTVVDDHSEESCVMQIRSQLSQASFSTQMISMQDRRGNGASLLTCYEYAKEKCEQLIYFVEDDYLHSEDAISELFFSYQQISAQVASDVVLFPCDYPNLYRRKYPSAILLSQNRYWRNIAHTTATILLRKRTLMEHWHRFMDLTNYGIDPAVTEDTTINKVYETVPCFSPMPSLVVHLSSPECISPFVPWQNWWERSV